MKDAKQTPDNRLRTCIPFEGSEKKRFKIFLANKGLKIGSFFRLAALDAMRKERELGGSK